MRTRPRPVLIVGMLLMALTLTLAACERDRPPASAPAQSTSAPARGTVAPSPTLEPAITQITLSGTRGAGDAAAGAQATAQPGAAVTPTPPAPQQVVVNPTTQAGGTSAGQASQYTVQAGDTLAAIAARFGVTQAALAELNNLADPNLLTVGQVLRVPGASAGGTGTTTTTGSTSVYVIQAGDTIGTIARRFGTTVAEIVRLNNLSNPDFISVGQKLVVPASGSSAPAAETTTGGQTRNHVVQAGETLLSIARRYGITVAQIQAANQIQNPDRIFPGQVLVIP